MSVDVLDSIQITKPCTVSWDAMAGDGRSRFCPQCRMNVYNVAGMTRADADALIGAAEGRLCVRLFRRHHGTVMTADCPGIVRAAASEVWRWGGIAALMTVSLFWSFLMMLRGAPRPDLRTASGALRPLIDFLDPPPPPPPVAAPMPVMGEVCIPRSARGGGGGPGALPAPEGGLDE